MFVVMFQNLPFGPFESRELAERRLEEHGWTREVDCKDPHLVSPIPLMRDVWVKKLNLERIPNPFIYASVREVLASDSFG